MRESLTKLNGCAQLYLQTEEHRAFAARRGIAAPSRSPPPRSPPRTGSGAPRATPHGAAAAPLAAALTPPAAARLAKQRSQGGGTELAQVRPYEPGDDVRRIDWNVTARMLAPHVRVHVPERSLTTWLVLDESHP